MKLDCFCMCSSVSTPPLINCKLSKFPGQRHRELFERSHQPHLKYSSLVENPFFGPWRDTRIHGQHTLKRRVAEETSYQTCITLHRTKVCETEKSDKCIQNIKILRSTH